MNLQNTFMILGSILLIAAFIIPLFIEQKFAMYLGEAATPFLSAAAFLLLVSANIMQQKELSLQREELIATRDVFTEQSKTMALQQFENTFFNIVNNHNEIIKGMGFTNNHPGDGKTYEGRKVFRFYKYLIIKKIEESKDNKDSFKVTFQESLSEVFSEFDYLLDHYFKNVLTIIKLIDINEGLTFEEKRFYLNMFFSLLSSDEKYVLYCFLNSNNGREIKDLFQSYNPSLEWFLDYEDINALSKRIQ